MKVVCYINIIISSLCQSGLPKAAHPNNGDNVLQYSLLMNFLHLSRHSAPHDLQIPSLLCWLGSLA
ncbi:hypothetical protein HanXRQr2_Chr17g0786781 [Helianthus annuus]|uniref:Uncharacterized protein n=1 Tax=Helianthus annuus TaxID=4232 RepID=A0A9K3DG33_HELAN|nr:hypothetical protein HanXRQr2_Chr17g0786781 [Helianthus annuus]KAJ0811818.1 hypothetical protein HanPSC8_Chr17g0755011 [Helianthus annuus]